MARRKSRISSELLDELLAGEDPREAFQSGELFAELQRSVAERALQAEMEVHLSSAEEVGSGNHRNGHNRKRVLTGTGSVELAVPRDREGRFEPQLIEKWARRLPGFDEKVISLYARGMTTREIRAHVEELYGVTVSRELISKVTDEIHEELREWRSRPAGGGVSVGVFRRVAGEDPRGGGGSEQGGSPGDRDYGAGAEGDFGDVDGGERGGEVLVGGDERVEGAGRSGCVDCGGGRVEGVSGGDRGGVSGGDGADLRGAPDPVFAGARVLEGAEGVGGGAASDLPGGHGGGSGGGAGRVRGEFLGPEVPGDRAELAAELGAGDPVLRVFEADPAGDLHDERDREPEQHGAACGADAGAFSERPGGDEADLPDAAEDRTEVAAAADVSGPRRAPSSRSCSATGSRWRLCEPAACRAPHGGGRSASRPPAECRRRRLEPVESAVLGKSRRP